MQAFKPWIHNRALHFVLIKALIRYYSNKSSKHSKVSISPYSIFYRMHLLKPFVYCLTIQAISAAQTLTLGRMSSAQSHLILISIQCSFKIITHFEIHYILLACKRMGTVFYYGHLCFLCRVYNFAEVTKVTHLRASNFVINIPLQDKTSLGW